MSYDASESLIIAYIDPTGNVPFERWFSRLDEVTARKVIVAITRVKTAGLINCKSLHKSLWEIKINHGPGIRVYFGKRSYIIVLLWGGTKHMQSQDIDRASKYWANYLKEEDSIVWH